jgi:hypothetical protein
MDIIGSLVNAANALKSSGTNLLDLVTSIYSFLTVIWILVTWLTIKGAFMMFLLLFEVYSMAWRLLSSRSVFDAYSKFLGDNRTFWTFTYQLVEMVSTAVWNFVQLINPLKWLI